MVLSSVPAVSFAATTNRISNVVTGDDDTDLIDNAPTLRMYEKDLNDVVGKSTSHQAFQLDLTNAEWLDGIGSSYDTGKDEDVVDEDGKVISQKDIYADYVDSDGNLATEIKDGVVTDSEPFISGLENVKVTRLSSRSIIIEGDVDGSYTVDGETGISVRMLTSLTDEGDATVTIDPMDSVISSGSYKFATVAEGSTTVTVEKKKDVSENGAQLKNIVIKETSPNAIDSGDVRIKLKLTSDWSFKDFKPENVSVYPSDYVDSINIVDMEDEEAYIELKGVKADRDTAMTISFAPTVEYDDDEVEPGDICEMTVSDGGVSKTTLEVATAVTYGVTWEAEDKTVPTFYWGSADNDDDTLEVHFEETVANSWLSNRKTKIVFPEEVKVLGVDIENVKNIDTPDYEIDDNEITLIADHDSQKLTDTVEADFTFQISVEPGFTGDITATIQGKGVDEEISAVVATAAAPVTVTAESTDAVIDYRQTPIGDITITEAEAGVLGKDDTLTLKMDNLGFDDDPTVEVVSGDLKIDSVKVDGDDDNLLKIKIKSESSKEPAVIKVSNVNLYMERNIPAGSYALKLTASDTVGTDYDKDKNVYGEITGSKSTGWEIADQSDAIFKNAVTDSDKYDGLPVFDTRNVTVVEDYVNVVTAGRDQGDNTFTTQIKVTIGATEMYANDQAIALDVPAYISNGYTMLPVRAVTEALSDVAVVRWDDPTHTVTISFGERVVKMTVGSNVMVVNGVEVPMQAQCEITGERAFIPLRDMGYALGLNDSKIVWDDATKTATLN